MTLTLSSTDLARVEHALATILSPLTYDSPAAWGDAVMTACQPLFGADHMLFGQALSGQFEMQGQGARIDDAIAEYVRDYWQVDPGMTVRRPELGLTIYHRDHVYDRGELPRTTLYHEWCVPHRMLDKIGIAAEGALTGTAAGRGFSPLPPLLHFFRERDGTADEARDRLALLALIKPSLMAALRTLGHFNAQRSQILAHFDTTPLGILALDLDGQALYENPALGTLFTEAHDRKNLCDLAADIARSHRPYVHRVNGFMHRAPRSAGAHTARSAVHRSRKPDASCEPNAPWRLYRTARHTFRLHSSLLGPGLIARADAVIITVERVTPAPLTDETLRTAFRLTPREIDVARCLAQSLATRAISSALGISYNTVRRHTEMVFLKLGVSDRGAAGAALRGEQPVPRAPR